MLLFLPPSVLGLRALFQGGALGLNGVCYGVMLDLSV